MRRQWQRAEQNLLTVRNFNRSVGFMALLNCPTWEQVNNETNYLLLRLSLNGREERDDQFFFQLFQLIEAKSRDRTHLECAHWTSIANGPPVDCLFSLELSSQISTCAIPPPPPSPPTYLHELHNSHCDGWSGNKIFLGCKLPVKFVGYENSLWAIMKN